MQEILRVLIAPDSFKGSAGNQEVANAIARGWEKVRPQDTISKLPMADGGEETLETFATRFPTAKRFTARVNFYEKETREATWLLLDDGTAIVELAEACGLTHMKTLDPLKASTFAFGELLKSAAANPDVKKIIACLGGSASTDGGVGALMALGARFYKASGDAIELGGQGLLELHSLDLSKITKTPESGVVSLFDVSNFLLGEDGAARVYGPQKGATEEEIKILEDGLKQLVKVTAQIDFSGAGSAGGTSFGMNFGWGSTLASGSQTVGEILGLREEISAADIVITGEGRFDNQSAQGKVVGLIQEISKEHEKRLLLCVGSSALDFSSHHLSGEILEEIAGSAEKAISEPLKWLEQAGELLALKV